jgi:glycosyltransferase involved in cell wall biosynthesis
MARSLNLGFSRASGEYLSWTSDDNEYYPSAIEVMISTLQASPEIDFVYADMEVSYESTNGIMVRHFPDEPDLNLRNDIGACFLYTRRIYSVIGDYDPRWTLVEDFEYWIRIHRQFKMKHLNCVLYLYRYHSRSLTLTKVSRILAMDTALKYDLGIKKLRHLVVGFYKDISSARIGNLNEAWRVISDIYTRVSRISLRLASLLAVTMLFKWIHEKMA